MFNTLPSNSVGGAAGAAGSTVNGGALIPSNFRAAAPTFAQRRPNLQAFFENTAGNIFRLGTQFAWTTHTTTLTTAYANALSVQGPGVVDFLAVYKYLGAASTDVKLRMLIDGLTVLEINPGWDNSSDLTDGYVLIGDLLWKGTPNFVPEYGGLTYRAIPFNSHFAIQLASVTGTNTDDFQIAYRMYT